MSTENHGAYSVLWLGNKVYLTAEGRRFLAKLRSEAKRKIRPCNCGGPQYGTDHSPDCAMVEDEISNDLDDEDEA